MIYKFELRTARESLHDITATIQGAINKNNITEGCCIVFCPHTTAGITINENADPHVMQDLLIGLGATFPDRREFRHAEGNSAAHLKASYVGASETIIIQNGSLLLGAWQGIYFCEFDGPRNRNFYVQIL